MHQPKSTTYFVRGVVTGLGCRPTDDSALRGGLGMLEGRKDEARSGSQWLKGASLADKEDKSILSGLLSLKDVTPSQIQRIALGSGHGGPGATDSPEHSCERAWIRRLTSTRSP